MLLKMQEWRGYDWSRIWVQTLCKQLDVEPRCENSIGEMGITHEDIYTILHNFFYTIVCNYSLH